MTSAERNAALFDREAGSIAADLRAKKLQSARVKAGVAQWELDVAVATLGSADDLQSHFTSEFASDPTLAKRITKGMLHALTKQIASGKLKLGRLTLALTRSDQKHLLKQLNQLVGHPLLELIGGSVTTNPQSQLLDLLQSLNLLAAVTYRTS